MSSSMTFTTQSLHWTQRIALIRHNLHAASRSGDFSFFKTLQAAGLIAGTNHIAALAAELGDDADVISVALDNLNAGLAYVHQDAFKNVYDNYKSTARDADQDVDSAKMKAKLHVDITMQKNMADMAIDKMTSSAIALISQQPEKAQDAAANVWVTGVTIVADCMEMSLHQMEFLEDKLDDFIRLEESWNVVRASIVGAITGLKGVFRLMDPQQDNSARSSPRNSSIASASSAVFRRLSNAFTSPPAPNSRASSVVSASAASSSSFNHNAALRSASVSSLGPVYRTPNYLRNSVSNGCPTSMPSGSDFERHKLSTIPPTPSVGLDDLPDPFEDSAPPIPELPAIQPLPPMPAPVALIDNERREGLGVM